MKREHKKKNLVTVSVDDGTYEWLLSLRGHRSLAAAVRSILLDAKIAARPQCTEATRHAAIR